MTRDEMILLIVAAYHEIVAMVPGEAASEPDCTGVYVVHPEGALKTLLAMCEPLEYRQNDQWEKELADLECETGRQFYRGI